MDRDQDKPLDAVRAQRERGEELIRQTTPRNRGQASEILAGREPLDGVFGSKRRGATEDLNEEAKSSTAAELSRRDAVAPLSAPARADLREQRIAALNAVIFDDKRISERFEGRGWDSLGREEKRQLFQDSEKMTAGLEGRKQAKILIKSEAEFQQARMGGATAVYLDGAHEIWLHEDKVVGPQTGKWAALESLFHEQAHAEQRDMVGRQELQRQRGEVLGSKWAGELPESRIAELSTNFLPENRIAPGNDAVQHLAYLTQPAEVHAREKARDRVQRLGMLIDSP